MEGTASTVLRRLDLVDLMGLNQRFSRYAAPAFDRDSRRIRALSRLRAIEQYTAIRGKRLLDVGCGLGDLVKASASRTRLSVGIDIEIWNMELDGGPMTEGWSADETGTRSLVQADSCHIPLADASFDVVACFWTFEHIVGYRQAFAEFLRILASRGILYLDVGPLYYSSLGHHLFLWLHVPWGHLVFDAEVIERFLEQIGQSRWFPRYLELNRLTASQLRSLVDESGLQVLHFQTDREPLSYSYWMFRERLLDYSVEDLTCTRAVCVLVKPG